MKLTKAATPSKSHPTGPMATPADSAIPRPAAAAPLVVPRAPTAMPTGLLSSMSNTRKMGAMMSLAMPAAVASSRATVINELTCPSARATVMMSLVASGGQARNAGAARPKHGTRTVAFGGGEAAGRLQLQGHLVHGIRRGSDAARVFVDDRQWSIARVQLVGLRVGQHTAIGILVHERGRPRRMGRKVKILRRLSVVGEASLLGVGHLVARFHAKDLGDGIILRVQDGRLKLVHPLHDGLRVDIPLALPQNIVEKALGKGMTGVGDSTAAAHVVGIRAQHLAHDAIVEVIVGRVALTEEGGYLPPRILLIKQVGHGLGCGARGSRKIQDPDGEPFAVDARRYFKANFIVGAGGFEMDGCVALQHWLIDGGRGPVLGDEKIHGVHVSHVGPFVESRSGDFRERRNPTGEHDACDKSKKKERKVTHGEK